MTDHPPGALIEKVLCEELAKRRPRGFACSPFREGRVKIEEADVKDPRLFPEGSRPRFSRTLLHGGQKSSGSSAHLLGSLLEK